MLESNIFSITTNIDGYVLVNESATSIFNNCKNIYDIDGLANYRTILNQQFNDKKLLINVLEDNYFIFKIPLNLNGVILNQFIFDPYKVSNNILFQPNKMISARDFIIESYSSIEQEVTFSLVNGYIQDKEILTFLDKCNSQIIDSCKLKYAIQKLLNRFDTNLRTDLARKLIFYNLDKYFPISLFKPGLYDKTQLL